MKTIKTILKPFLRIIACLMYIPLSLLSIIYSAFFLLFLIVCAGISFLFTGDIDTIPERIADTLDKHKDADKYLSLFFLDDDCGIVLNYTDMVFDKINEW